MGTFDEGIKETIRLCNFSIGLKEEEVNLTGTTFIKENYNKLLNYCKKITGFDDDNAYCILSNVYIGISKREDINEWKADEMSVEPIVYKIIQNYAKNPKYLCMEYDNKDKLIGEVSHIRLSNTEEGEDRYHSIFESITSTNNFETQIEERMELNNILETLETDKQITLYGKNLLKETIYNSELMADNICNNKIDVSLYGLLSEYEKRLLYQILKLKIKILKEGDKEYVQYRGK